jgi:hypothetical protein
MYLAIAAVCWVIVGTAVDGWPAFPHSNFLARAR